MRSVRKGFDKPAVRQLSRREIWYYKGQASFWRGDPEPENIWPDEEWNGPCNEDQCFWLGYKVARGLKMLRDEKRKEAVKDYIEHGHDLPPNF